MLAKGMTPDSGGRKRLFSRSRLRYPSVLPQCPLVRIYRKVLTVEMCTRKNRDLLVQGPGGIVG